MVNGVPAPDRERQHRVGGRELANADAPA